MKPFCTIEFVHLLIVYRRYQRISLPYRITVLSLASNWSLIWSESPAGILHVCRVYRSWNVFILCYELWHLNFVQLNNLLNCFINVIPFLVFWRCKNQMGLACFIWCILRSHDFLLLDSWFRIRRLKFVFLHSYKSPILIKFPLVLPSVFVKWTWATQFEPRTSFSYDAFKRAWGRIEFANYNATNPNPILRTKW